MSLANAISDLKLGHFLYIKEKNALDGAVDHAVRVANHVLEPIWRKHTDAEYPALDDFAFSAGIHSDNWDLKEISYFCIFKNTIPSESERAAFCEEATRVTGVKVTIQLSKVVV